MSSCIQLIVGLKNPGQRYAGTRHNAGAWLIERLCIQYAISLKTQSSFHCDLGEASFQNHCVKIALPIQYMNKSGHCVQALSQFYQIPLDNILVAHDELDLPVGTVRLKSGGGHGGHNGLRDIIEKMGGQKVFHRIRVGIGHPGHKEDVTDYVLHKPSKEDKLAIDAGIERALNVMDHIVCKQFDLAMNKLH